MSDRTTEYPRQRARRRPGASLRIKLLIYCWAGAAVFVAGMVAGGLLSQQSQAAEQLPGLVGSRSSKPSPVYMDRTTQRIIIDAPFIDQRDEYPTGCESVTAVMALGYAGIQVEVEDFIGQYLDTASEPWPDAYGCYHSVSPEQAYLGDPRSPDGWGCYAPVIKRAVESLLEDKGSAAMVTDLTGTSLDGLWQDYISQGIPVMLWATMYMDEAQVETTLYLEGTGEALDWLTPEHCLLLVGADDDSYYFNDPLAGKAVAYGRDEVERAYQALGRQALAVR